MKKRALGILLSTGPDNPNLTTAIGLSHAALKAGVDVYLYLIDEGVLTVDDPRFQPLRDSGLKLFACAYGAQRLDVPRKDDKATYCGLVVLSNIVSTCDRFVPLNWMCGMDRPSPKTLIMIQVDPTKSHRAVEALRIALGLGSHNEGQDISIVLCGRAPYLLAEDSDDIVDAEILEKHLPVFVEWGTPFFIAIDAETPHRYLADVVTKPITTAEISVALESADRTLIFS